MRALAQTLFDGREQADPAAVALAVSGMFATDAPRPEATSPGQGAGSMIPRDTHQHPRLTSVTVATIATGNTAQVQFTRAFTNEPGIDYQELPATANTTTPNTGDTDPSSQPTISRVVAWTKGPTAALPNAAATDYTGCTVRIWRGQVMPTQSTGLTVASLLTGVISAVNTLAASITGFNAFGAGVVGTRFSLIAVARSDV